MRTHDEHTVLKFLADGLLHMTVCGGVDGGDCFVENG